MTKYDMNRVYITTWKVVAKNSGVDEDKEVRLKSWSSGPKLGTRVKRAIGDAQRLPRSRDG
jgi:hypothetical protein